MMDEKKALMKKISEMQFKALELGLYLDTHPKCEEGLRKFSEACAKYKELVKQYEKEFGPITLCGDFGNDGFDWTNNHWPWEREAN